MKKIALLSFILGFSKVVYSQTDVISIIPSGNVGISSTAPVSSLEIAGSYGQKVTTITANVTLDATHNTVVCNNGGTAIIVTLPAASGATGRVYVIKRNAASTANVTVAGGPTLDGAASFVLTSANQSIEVFSDGNEWKSRVGGLSGLGNLSAGNDIDFGTSSTNSIDIEPTLNFVHTVSAPATNNLNLNAASGFAVMVNNNNGTTGATQSFRIGNGAGGSDVFYVYADGQAFTTNWWRSLGSTGWFNQTYGGGIWMDQANYVRVYNGKGFTVPANVGIGTDAPNYKLEVRSTNTGQAAYIRSDATTGTNYGIDAEAMGSGATTNIAGYFAASGATNNYAIIVPSGFGNVGIGLTAPNSFKVQVAGDAGPNADLTYNLGSPSLRWNNLYVNSIQGPGALWTRSGTSLYNTTLTDNVGIGTSSPNKLLDVIAPANDFVTVGANTLGVGQWTGIHFGYRENNTVYRKSAIVFERTDNSGGGGNAAGKIHFLNGPATGSGSATLADTRMTISELGNVGIGITAPNAPLEVRTTTAANFPVLRVSNDAASGETGIRFRTQSSGASNAHSDISWTATGAETGNLVFRVPYTNERMRIQSDGNVGIGIASPARLLDINGTTRMRDWLSFGSSDDIGRITWGSDRFYMNGFAGKKLSLGSNAVVDHLLIDLNGNVGINQTSPTVKLQVGGDILRTNTRVSNSQRYPVAHNMGEDMLNIDPTWSNAELQAYFNSSNVQWSNDATAPSGYAIQITGPVNVGAGDYGSGFPYIPIENGATYYMECWIRSSSASTTHYMGSIEYNENFGGGSGNPGSYGYWVMSNYAPGTSWVKVTGVITGFGSSTGQFQTGKKYWTPQALFNYANGAGVNTFISGWKVVKIPSSTSMTIPSVSTNYIQNQTSGDQTAGFRINGNGLFNGGNVGIGTTAPATKMQLNYTSSGGLTGLTAYGGIHLDQDAGNDGFTGITSSATSSGTQAGILFQGSGSYGTKIHFLTTGSYASGMQNRMMLDYNGYLGIATTSPATLLNVNLGAGDATVGTAAIRVGGTTNYPSLELGIKGGYDGMISTYGNDLHIYSGNWRTAGATATENHNIWFYTSQVSSTNWNTAKMVLTSTGNLGVGSTAPTQKLTVAGNINKSGSWIAGDAVWGANFFEVHNNSWDGISNGNYGGIIGGHMYSYGGIDIGTSGGNEAAGGQLVAATDIKSPIYYDRDNTSYYVNPNANSVINTVTVAGGSPAAGKVLTSTDGAGNATWQYPSNAWEYVGDDVRSVCNGGAADLVYEWGVTYNNIGTILRVTCNTWNVGYRVCSYPPYPTGDSEPFRWGGVCWIWNTSSAWDNSCSRYYHSYYYQTDEGKYEMWGGNGCDQNPGVYRRKL